ncbi:hypothetical protein AGMMS49940_05720 [Spirochaetia bacterium]|nr:hypothetical protein AGMMS49940_05720 [Spirochaetia bacterium]
MKRVFLICVIGAALCVSGVFAEHPEDQIGIGLQLGGSYTNWFGADFTLKIPKVPVFWTLGAGLNWLSVAGDYYFIDKEFAPKIHLGWYLGAGAEVGLGFWGYNAGYFGLAVGARVPIGLSWQPLDWLEVYLQVVPGIGIQIVPPVDLYLPIGGSLGVRFWI